MSMSIRHEWTCDLCVTQFVTSMWPSLWPLCVRVHVIMASKPDVYEYQTWVNLWPLVTQFVTYVCRCTGDDGSEARYLWVSDMSELVTSVWPTLWPLMWPSLWPLCVCVQEMTAMKPGIYEHQTWVNLWPLCDPVCDLCVSVYRWWLQWNQVSMSIRLRGQLWFVCQFSLGLLSLLVDDSQCNVVLLCTWQVVLPSNQLNVVI